MGSLIFFGLILVAVIYGVTLYNGLVQIKHAVAKAWANLVTLIGDPGLSIVPTGATTTAERR